MSTHPVEQEMGLPAWEIMDVIRRSDRCYQIVRGYVAERHLEHLLERLSGQGQIDSFDYINTEGEPDFRTSLRGVAKTIECKNVLKGFAYANGDFKVDFQRTRNQLGGGARTGRFYKVEDFDILAACEYNRTGRWEFKFIRTSDLPSLTIDETVCLVKAVHVPLSTQGTFWTTSLVTLL